MLITPTATDKQNAKAYQESRVEAPKCMKTSAEKLTFRCRSVSCRLPVKNNHHRTGAAIQGRIVEARAVTDSLHVR